MTPYVAPCPVYVSPKSKPKFNNVIWTALLAITALLLWVLGFAMAYDVVSWGPTARQVSSTCAAAAAVTCACLVSVIRYTMQRANAEDHAAVLAVMTDNFDRIAGKLDELAGKIDSEHSAFAEGFQYGAGIRPDGDLTNVVTASFPSQRRAHQD